MAERKITTAKDLRAALYQIDPIVKPRPTDKEMKPKLYTLMECMDECYPGLYIGDSGAAKDKVNLQNVGITHVLNTAQGNKFASVSTDPLYYDDIGIKYQGMKLLDLPTANIAQFFQEGADFIDDALNSKGKVLVHCYMGISRSSTIACAFLMLKRNMSAHKALTTLRAHRAIDPNEGFLQQLAELDNNMQSKL